ncbi:MAG: hypothetical protein JWQ14_1692, partial [Adhaeribacter sp.]|nr:hypothetical protein [Adhaeribacter sp.]
MGAEIITDILIDRLLHMPKIVLNPNIQTRKKERHEEKNFELKGE